MLPTSFGRPKQTQSCPEVKVKSYHSKLHCLARLSSPGVARELLLLPFIQRMWLIIPPQIKGGFTGWCLSIFEQRTSGEQGGFVSLELSKFPGMLKEPALLN